MIGVLLIALPAMVLASDGEEAAYVSEFYGTFWSLAPPLLAIVLALITKEVYISLFVGIFMGGLLYANFNPVKATISIAQMYISRVGDSWNAGILIFLVILGVMVALMNAAGGSAAYGKWAAARMKSKEGATLSTVGLGVLIFVDDYFNCLTVGSVMQPVTDKFKVSRAKLAYIIDATAAPVCIIAPISSWAAAVTGSVTGDTIDGFKVFLRAIPYNYYALLTILFMVVITLLKFDYGPMKKAGRAAESGDLFNGQPDEYAGKEIPRNERGKVIDLMLPTLMLIVLCILGMVYTGGFFDGTPFVEAFADCDASAGLVIGSLAALIFTFIYYMLRRVITFKQFAACLPEGFRQMVPAILILTFAWTLSGFCRESLGAGDYVGAIVQNSAVASGILPAIFYLIACGVSFATGTSWGTFGILIPIAQSVFPGDLSQILVITIAACMAGAVFGDHCSPISDTTIMASAGARVNHIQHVSTQLPYAITVGLVSLICFVLAGFVGNWMISLGVGILLMTGTLFVLRAVTAKK
jgi:Na+/H+ antiporter NhaC